ncbi:MAG: lipid biosynthesis B12-binding/radical SAM protein [Desulfobacterales bacterium]|jgi:radical SAM superfamily enzyme YgiQ (UPF0313 family)|nr:lipid biosynthesis B12-binding/radical SAM protein [Desulfobacterales bacterium]
MNVLLVSPNIEYLPDPVFPIGLAYLAAALKKNGTPHRILDLCFEADYEHAIATAIAEFSPHVIGVSLRNLDNVGYPRYTAYLPFYRRVIAEIRNCAKGIIVIGGSGFTLLPESVFAHLGADFGIAGEGEDAFIRLINDIEKNGPTHVPPDGRIIFGKPGIRANLDALPMADRSGFDNAAYLQQGGMGNIQTKRGCPFHCIYCTYPLIEGKSIRARSPERVCDEIEQLIEIGVHNLFIVDNEFNYPVNHALSLCREIIKRQLKIRWSCYANPAFMTDELAAAMRNAGCTGVEFGCDAAEPGMLAALGKNFSVADIQQASRICRNAGMAFCHSLLLGGPGETMDSVRRTCETIRDTDPTAVVCMAGIRVYPNTRMAQVAAEEGLVGSGEDYLNPVFYLSSGIKTEILSFIEAFSKDNPTWIFPGLQINMNEILQKKLRRFGVRGPLWEQMKLAGRFAHVAKSSID